MIPKAFAPNFKPVSSAPLIRVEHRDAPRAFHRNKSERQHDENSRDRNNKNTTPAARQCHHKHSDAKSGERCSRRSKDHVIASSGIARVKKKAALDRLFGVAIRRPTASAAMS